MGSSCHSPVTYVPIYHHLYLLGSKLSVKATLQVHKLSIEWLSLHVSGVGTDMPSPVVSSGLLHL